MRETLKVLLGVLPFSSCSKIRAPPKPAPAKREIRICAEERLRATPTLISPLYTTPVKPLLFKFSSCVMASPSDGSNTRKVLFTAFSPFLAERFSTLRLAACGQRVNRPLMR